MNAFLDAALAYHDRGWHPFPLLPKTKKPCIEWKPYQTQQPTEVEIRQWWARYPDANVALATGRGLFVIDLDGPEAEALLAAEGIVLPAEAPRVRTGRDNGGQHVYLTGPTDLSIGANLVATPDLSSHVDYRSTSGYVMAPPSIHDETGKTYRWINDIPAVLPAVPLRFVDLIREKKQREVMQAGAVGAGEGGGWVREAMAGTSQGSRDTTAARLTGYFLAKGHPPDIVEGILLAYATLCRPPLMPPDVQRIVRSISQAEARKPHTHSETDARGGDMAEPLKVALEQVAIRAQAGPAMSVRTPLASLNTFTTGGFSPGEFILLGARPSVGKTALALEFATAAGKAGHTVLVVSREMTNEAVARRMVAQAGQINARELKAGEVSDQARLAATFRTLGELPIWLSERAMTVEQITGIIRGLPQPPALVIVDYLQLMRGPSHITDHRLEIEAVSQSLKTLAKAWHCVVLCVSSLSRPPAGARDQRPSLANLRDSGELEHDADLVLLLHRTVDEPTLVECIVAKNRDGETGAIKLLFRPEWVSFVERDYEDDDKQEANSHAWYK